MQRIKGDEDFEEAKDLLINLNLLTLNTYFAAEGAANIYRTVRKKGLTIRKPYDCIIAFCAIPFKLPLVHNTKDFDIIARHTKLKTYST